MGSVLLILIISAVNVLKPFNFESPLGTEFIEAEDADGTTAFNWQLALFFSSSIIMILSWVHLKDKVPPLIRLLIPLAFSGFLVSPNLVNTGLINGPFLVSILVLIHPGVNNNQLVRTILAACIVLVWSAFSNLSVIGVLWLLVFNLTQNKITRSSAWVIIATTVLLSVIVLFVRSTELIFPEVSISTIANNIRNFHLNSLTALLLSIPSLVLIFYSKSPGVSVKAFVVALICAGLLFKGHLYFFAGALLLAISTAELKEFRMVSSLPKFTLTMTLYLGLVTSASSTISHWTGTANLLKPGLTDEMELIEKVISQNKIFGNVFCLEEDLTEAKYYFKDSSSFSTLEFDDAFYADQLIWLNHRSQDSYNIIFFNLHNKSNAELEFLGERLAEPEWAMIYHTIESKAILIRREQKFGPIINQFEIIPQ